MPKNLIKNKNSEIFKIKYGWYCETACKRCSSNIFVRRNYCNCLTYCFLNNNTIWMWWGVVSRSLRTKVVYPTNCWLILKIQIICDVKTARYIQNEHRHFVKSVNLGTPIAFKKCCINFSKISYYLLHYFSNF